jgi:hypothetical protein
VGRCWKPCFAGPWRSTPAWLPPTCGPTLAAALSCLTPTTQALRRAHGDHAHAQGQHGARLNAFQDDANQSVLLDEQGKS